jgi:hypothetical protein
MIATGLVLLFTLCAGALLPLLARRSNCGGNSAALSACEGYISVLELWGAKHDSRTFRYSQADREARENLQQLPGASWIRSGRLLARLDEVHIDPAAQKRIIMVCDRPYNNVPQRLFGRSPMAHAVAYTTGETGLISPEEFARLDLTDFTDLRALGVETEVEQNSAAGRSRNRLEAPMSGSAGTVR